MDYLDDVSKLGIIDCRDPKINYGKQKEEKNVFPYQFFDLIKILYMYFNTFEEFPFPNSTPKSLKKKNL